MSAESSSNWKLENDLQWEYGEKETAATAYMLMRIVEAKYALFFYRGNLSSKNFYAVLDIFMNKYLKPWIKNRKVCVWGMGEYGRRLTDLLEQRDIKVKCFGDSDNTKCGTAYNQINCLSLKQIKEESNQTNFCIFLAISHYEKIYSQLISEMPGTDIRVINIL